MFARFVIQISPRISNNVLYLSKTLITHQFCGNNSRNGGRKKNNLCATVGV